jgi:3-hydroxymyristoyl/3-hydroxydecanoyl-(acyl carrier protein) dehydratase
MTFEVSCVIEKEHPALAGHFPGNPIVPGALILDEVVVAARQWRGQLRVKKIVSAKFSSPLKPGRPFSIKLAHVDHSHIEFECLLDGFKLACGRIEVELGAGEP